MKVLGWFHNKFKHNTTASLKTSTEARSSFGCSTKHEIEFKKFPKDVRLENEGFANELFEGFLAIGTLGGELVNTEAPTPTFSNILEDSANEVKLISSKLEEFFEAEQEPANKTSNILSNYQTEEKITACPLQKYLFSSSFELQETEMAIKKGENPLGELFKRRTGHDSHHEKRGKQRDATHFLKKMLKKIHPISVSTKTLPRDAGHGSLLERKLPKVGKLFHRKVHPEGSMTPKELTKSCNKSLQESFIFGCQGGICEENTIFPQNVNAEMVTSSKTVTGIPPTANREHWIKTDTEYLVLEL